MGGTLSVGNLINVTFMKFTYNRVLAKLGYDALASPFDEAKAIVSDEFCKMYNITLTRVLY